MRETYLTGADAADTTDTQAVATQADNMHFFESITLTEDFYMKLVGVSYITLNDQLTEQEFTLLIKKPPHPELLKVLRRLTLHMCLLTEQLTDAILFPETTLPPRFALREAVDSGEVYVHPLMENFRCTAVTWKSKGMVLAGERKTRYRCFGKHLKIETPVTTIMRSLDDDEAAEEDNYPFFEELDKALGDLRAEAAAYMNGKYGEFGEQLSLFGKDPEPRTIGAIADELISALDNANYTVEVGVPGGEMHKVGGGKAKRSFKGKELDSE